MKTVKARLIFLFVQLVFLGLYSFPYATAQTPQPTPASRRYAEGEAAFGEAARLYSIHTTESMEAALELCEKGRKAFVETGSKQDEGMTLMLMGHINKDLGNQRIALKNFQQALPLFEKTKDRELEAVTRSNIGAAYADLKEPQRAVEAYNLALPIMREVNNKAGEAEVLFYLGTVYEELSEKQKAVEHYKQALPIYKALSDRKQEAETLRRIGKLQAALGEKQEALKDLNQALTMLRAAGNRKKDEAMTLAIIGEIYVALDNHQKALDAYRQALPLMIEVKDKDGQATSLYNLGVISLKLDEKPQAVEYFNQSLPLYRFLGDQEGEGASLSKLARFYEDSGEKEKALEYFNQYLEVNRASGDREEEAAILIRLGNLHEKLRHEQKALEHYDQALKLYKDQGNKKSEAVTLDNIGEIYGESGEQEKALAYYDQSLALKRSNGDDKGEAATLKRIGDLYDNHGERQKALEYLNQALQIQRTIGDKEGEALTLDSIGAVYDKLGEKQKALDYFLQVLSFNRANKTDGVVAGEAALLNNVGRMYDALGEQQKALEYLNKALTLHQAQGSKTGEATVTNNIGMVYADLGETRKALDYISRALKMYQSLGATRSESAALTNMAFAHYDLEENEKGFEYANQALRICRMIGDKEGEARNLSNIGMGYLLSGEEKKGLEFLTQALPLRRAVGDRAGEAATLHGIAQIHALSNEPQKAIEYLRQSLLLQRAVRNRNGEAVALMTLAALYGGPNSRPNSRQLAVLFGKQAINRYQELRGAARGIERQNQQTFLRSVESSFRGLSYLLLDEGCLAEALQILNLFKDQEFFDATKPDGATAVQARKAELTQREAAADEMYEAATAKLASANLRLLELEFTLKTHQPDADEEQQVQQLRAEFQAANDEAQNTLRKIEASFTEPAVEDKLETTSDTVEMQAALREMSERADSPTIALYTLTSPDKFYVLLVSPDKLISVATKVSALELTGDIIGNRTTRKDGLWVLLNSPGHDPRPQAKEIYDIVFKPIEPEIKRIEAAAKKQNPNTTVTLMWSLDWALRYIPMAALYDGERYLAERYRNVVFTRANKERLTRGVNATWTGLGFGITEAQTVKIFGEEKTYNPLPGAEKELATVFGTRETDGIIPGRIWLNERFTKAAFLAALKLRRSVVHVASHFTFEPGDEARSFLLLGQGEMMTLEEMKMHEGLFAGVELLTLSACNTAAQQSGAQGREIDGFAELAQRLGAGAVLATLWPVSDESTSALMEDFYKLRQEKNGRTKAEALRQAQLALLKGKLEVNSSFVVAKKSPAPQKKGGRADIVGMKEEPVNSPRYKVNPKAPFAHPHYWSGFVLIGNWL